MGRLYVWDSVEGPASFHVANASFCNFIVFVFALVAAFSPWYLQNSHPSNIDSESKYLLYGTGVFPASRFLMKTNGTIIHSKSVYWDEMINSGQGCSNETNIYEEFSGRYGFCDRVNGVMKKPAELKAIGAFVILTAIFCLCTLVSLFCTRTYESWGLRCSAMFSLLAITSSILSFSLVAASEWYQDLLNDRNGVLPFRDSQNKLVAITGLKLNYGPMYGLMVASFVMILLSCISLLFAASIEDDENAEELASEKGGDNSQADIQTEKETINGIQLT